MNMPQTNLKKERGLISVNLKADHVNSGDLENIQTQLVQRLEDMLDDTALENLKIDAGKDASTEAGRVYLNNLIKSFQRQVIEVIVAELEKLNKGTLGLKVRCDALDLNFEAQISITQDSIRAQVKEITSAVEKAINRRKEEPTTPSEEAAAAK